MRWIAGDLHQRLKIWTAYFAIKDPDLPVKNGLQSRPWDSKWIHIMFSDASQSVCLFSDLKKKKKLDPYTMYFEVDKQALSVTKLVAPACCDWSIDTQQIWVFRTICETEHLLVYGVDSRDKL